MTVQRAQSHEDNYGLCTLCDTMHGHTDDCPDDDDVARQADDKGRFAADMAERDQYMQEDT